jgi:hypothetical protein
MSLLYKKLWRDPMKTKYQELPVELLRSLLRYDSETGFLFWKERPVSMFKDHGGRYTAEWCAKNFNNKHAGNRALTAVNQSGYLTGGILGRVHSAHRVAWALHHGSWPLDGEDMDHINRVKQDNRAKNLRLATKTQNGHNRILHREKSPYIGVTWYKPTGKWVAKVTKDKKCHYLGTFTDVELAARARDRKAVELYGDRACLNFPLG